MRSGRIRLRAGPRMMASKMSKASVCPTRGQPQGSGQDPPRHTRQREPQAQPQTHTPLSFPSLSDALQRPAPQPQAERRHPPRWPGSRLQACPGVVPALSCTQPGGRPSLPSPGYPPPAPKSRVRGGLLPNWEAGNNLFFHLHVLRRRALQHARHAGWRAASGHCTGAAESGLLTFLHIAGCWRSPRAAGCRFCCCDAAYPAFFPRRT